MLHHTAGWAYNIGDPVWYAFNVANPVLPATEHNVVATMMTQAPSLSPPGQTFSYSNFGYNLLATLITKITGKDYETVVKEQVLHPIGITRTRVGRSLLSGRADGEVRYYTYAGTPSAQSMFPAATGPTIAGDDNIPYGTWSLEAGRGAGGWIASAMDVLRFQIGVNGRNPAAQVYSGIASISFRTSTSHPSSSAPRTAARSRHPSIRRRIDITRAGVFTGGGSLQRI